MLYTKNSRRLQSSQATNCCIVTLGYPWIATFQPCIDWKNTILDEEEQPLVIRTLDPSLDKEVAWICNAWIHHAEDLAKPGEEVFVWKIDNKQIRKASTSMQLAVKAKPQEEKTWDQIVQPQYHKWRKVFSEKEAWHLPEHQPWDISINLIGGDSHALDCKVYPLTNVERPKLDKHILDMLEKGFICPSKLKICSPLFFMGKKDGKECPVIDYRELNLITEPNWFHIPLLQEMIDKVQKAKLFSKVDIHEGFYNIHVAEGDDWKATLKTNSGLYEPTVMQFRLKNSPTVFQRMMNMQFADIIARGNIIIYFDDILISTKDDLEAHRKVVSQVLNWLQMLNLYLKPSKCIFETRRIEFPRVILENGMVMMDPIKVSGVKEW